MDLIARLFPRWALRREIARQQLARLYDAAQPSTQRKERTDIRSGNAVMEQAQGSLRRKARYLDENHDLVVGILDTLVQRIVGTGIIVEPMIKTKRGTLSTKVNQQIRRAWREWGRRPDASTMYPWGELQRLACLSWLRDGEVFAQHVEGTKATTALGVPYMVELIEADFCPFNLNETRGGARIVQGVQLAGWSRPVGFWFYLQHPGEATLGTSITVPTDVKFVSADQIIHLRNTRRLHQVRGVPILHSVLTRLEDIRDYEESERIAARVAAAFCAYIKRSSDFSGASALTTGDRSMEMQPGMIFDNLLPGEEVGTIATDRPNSGLESFRAGQLRAVAAGTKTNYSSISKDYNGTYSAQRQELVESRGGYDILRQLFVDVFVSEIYRRWLDLAIAAGKVSTKGTDPDTLYDADYRGPGLPWIDPLKETQAEALAVANGFKSRHQVIRERGNDPILVDEQLEDDTFEPAQPAQAAQGATAPSSGSAPAADEAAQDEPPDPAEERSALIALEGGRRVS